MIKVLWLIFYSMIASMVGLINTWMGQLHIYRWVTRLFDCPEFANLLLLPYLCVVVGLNLGYLYKR